MSNDNAAAVPQDNNSLGSTDQLASIEQRIEELSWRLDRLANQVAQLSYKHETDGDSESLDSPQQVPAAPLQAVETTRSDAPDDTPLAAQISPGLLEIIRLIAHGDAESAQQKLQRVPEHELTGQPAVAAMVAAALFVQRGEFVAGLKAISRARQLTDNPRLITLTRMIEKQARG